jgi:DNA-binding transcriptional regulator YiaG
MNGTAVKRIWKQVGLTQAELAATLVTVAKW